MNPFSIAYVDEDPIGLEPVGSKAIEWFDHVDGRKKLFKRARPGTGEHWAECVAAQLAAGLGLPHAEYDLAVREGQRGVISWSFLRHAGGEKTGSFVMGNEILARRIRGYPESSLRRRQRTALHTVDAVLEACSGVRPPPDVSLGLEARDGADAFVGYLLLDAWIANTDRHDRNWGWVEDPSIGPACLAPTFDHGSSLGRELSDSERAGRLHGPDPGYTVEAYATRARSPLFTPASGDSPLSPLAAFRVASSLRPSIARAWIERLRLVSSSDVAGIFDRVPDDWISETERRFAQRLLDVNRGNLLAEGVTGR